MMKKIVFVILALVSLLTTQASSNGSTYKLDELELEALFNNAKEIEVYDCNFELNLTNQSKKADPNFNTNQQTAAILAVIMIWTGIGELIPVHRFILGTNGNDVKIFFAYFCTASGCGVGLLLDAVFLLMNYDNTNYENNSKIIMWKE